MVHVTSESAEPQNGQLDSVPAEKIGRDVRDIQDINALIERLEREGADAFTKHYSLGMWKLCAEAAKVIRVLDERHSEANKWANHLAYAIARHFGEKIGSDPRYPLPAGPWWEAMEIMENAGLDRMRAVADEGAKQDGKSE